MYDIQFVATTSSGWSQAVGLTNAETDRPLDASSFVFELEVNSRGCGRTLFATTADGTIQRPQVDVIQWRFTPDQTRTLRRDTTYQVGCRMISDGGVSQLFVGTLALIDGEIR